MASFYKPLFSSSFSSRLKKFGKKVHSTFSALGPGVVTGAADDDPSGITTFSQAGAVTGTMFLWTAWFATPLMIAVQEMCARIGLVTGKGLTGVLKKHYPPLLLFFLAILQVQNLMKSFQQFLVQLLEFAVEFALFAVRKIPASSSVLVVRFPCKTNQNIAFKFIDEAIKNVCFAELI